MRSDKWKVEQEHVFSRPELSLTWLICLFQSCEYGDRDILEGRVCGVSRWAGSSFRRQETSVFFWASLRLLGEFLWWEVRPFTSILEGPLYEEKRNIDETGSTSADAGPQDLLELRWFGFLLSCSGRTNSLQWALAFKTKGKKVTDQGCISVIAQRNDSVEKDRWKQHLKQPSRYVILLSFWEVKVTENSPALIQHWGLIISCLSWSSCWTCF